MTVLKWTERISLKVARNLACKEINFFSTLISVELFIIWGPLSSSEMHFAVSQAIPCCASPKQGENTKCARAAPDTGSLSSSSAFCTAKLSTSMKITTYLLIISSLARAGGKPRDIDDIYLSHTLFWCVSPPHRPPCDGDAHPRNTHRGHSLLPEEITCSFHCLQCG